MVAGKRVAVAAVAGAVVAMAPMAAGVSLVKMPAAAMVSSPTTMTKKLPRLKKRAEQRAAARATIQKKAMLLRRARVTATALRVKAASVRKKAVVAVAGAAVAVVVAVVIATAVQAKVKTVKQL